MKIIITESQYKTLINEQTVYSSQKEYDKAMVNYNKKNLVYLFSKRLYDKRNIWPNYEINNPYWDKNENWKMGLQSEITKFKMDDLLNFLSFIVRWNKNYYTIPGIDVNTEEIRKIMGNPKVDFWYTVKYSYTPSKGSRSFIASDFSLPVFKKPIKPILQVPIPTPVTKTIPTKTITTPKRPTGTTTKQVVNKQTTIKPNPVTKFSVTWREDLPSGKVEQNTHYFKTYEEWKEFVTQYPHFSTKNENGSKTEAQALYSGLHADISKDKTY